MGRDQRREFHEALLEADDFEELPGMAGGDQPDTHGSRGQIHGHITLSVSPDVDAYLDVREVVVVEDGHVHREEYAYYLIVNGVELWGHERDPQHAPEDVHCHPREHSDRIPCDSISFAEYGLEDDFDPIGSES